MQIIELVLDLIIIGTSGLELPRKRSLVNLSAPLLRSLPRWPHLPPSDVGRRRWTRWVLLSIGEVHVVLLVVDADSSGGPLQHFVVIHVLKWS